MFIYTKKDFIEFLEMKSKTYRSGLNQVTEMARIINIASEHKDDYKTTCIEIFPELMFMEWVLAKKFLAFVNAVDFDKTFYEAFASFLKDSFPDQKPLMQNIKKEDESIFVRGQCIKLVASKHRELFDLNWILEKNKNLMIYKPWAYLNLLIVYRQNEALDLFTSLLKAKPEKYRFSLLIRYLNEFMRVFLEIELSTYVVLWGKLLLSDDVIKYNKEVERLSKKY